jgi:hypothetical protein
MRLRRRTYLALRVVVVPSKFSAGRWMVRDKPSKPIPSYSLHNIIKLRGVRQDV